MTPNNPSITVEGLQFRWDLSEGGMTVEDVACTLMFRDTSLAGLLAGFLQMVGPARFALALQANGLRSIEGDWAVITSEPTFDAGFAKLGAIAHITGWGRWECVEKDLEARLLVIRVHRSWEGIIQQKLGIRWDGGLIAGKFAAIGGRLLDTNCWCRQTMFLAEGDPYDEFVVEPSDRNIDDELARLAASEQATSHDLQRLLSELQRSSEARAKALEERDRSVRELEDKLSIIAEQRAAIQALSTPILQVWDGVLVAPIVGTVDSERTSRMMETLLETIIHTKSRYAIIDVTGVETVDTHTADNFVRLIRGVQLLGAEGIISGIGPLVAQTIVDLGVDLSNIPTHSNLKEALHACIAQATNRKAGGRASRSAT